MLKNNVFGGWLGALVMIYPALLMAEEAPTNELDEVVVQGEEIEEKAVDEKQATISSTTKLTGEELEDLGLTDFRSSLKIQGNTYVTPSNNGNNGISIRGINSEGVGEAGANSRPLITVVIDGAAQSVEGVRRGQRGTWDIDTISVARGPQSTLQGRNTLAGSVEIDTKDPTDYLEAAARLSAGQLDLLAPAVMVSGPISDSVSVRFAAESSEAEKDIEYTRPGTEFLREDEYRNLRGKLLYKPEAIDGLAIKLTVSSTVDDPAVPAVSGPEHGYDWRDRIFDVSLTAAERRRNEVNNNVIDINYQIDPTWELVSTTAYIETDAEITGVGGNSSLAYSRDESRIDNDITQTFRLLYEPDNSDFSGQLGVFLGRFNNERDSIVSLGTINLQNLSSERTDLNAAIFGELWWRFKPDWSLVTGLRIEGEETEQTTLNRYAGIQYDSDYQNEIALPKIGVVHDLNATDTLAFTISTGYRGGFREVEPIAGGTDNGGHDVDPETLTNFELAYRSSWLEDELQFNASLFYNNWKDQQVTIIKTSQNAGNNNNGSASVFTTTLNAGESHSYGLELDLAWNVFGRTNVGMSLGLLQTEFVEFDARPTVVGNEFPEAPNASGGLWFISRFGDNWFAAGDLSARSSAYATSDIYNDENKKIPGYAVTDLRAGYESDYYSVVLFIENVFDHEYLLGRDRLGGYYVADARTMGVTLTARY